MTEFIITDDVQKKKLLDRLAHAIESDCGGNRTQLQQMEAHGKTQTIAPDMLGVIKKNIDVREALYKRVIRNLEANKNLPISLEDYFATLMLSFATADIPEDPIKREYTSLILGVSPPPSQGARTSGVLPAAPKQDDAAANIRLMKMRAHTIHMCIEVVMDEFYCVTAAKDKVIKLAPDYQRFAALTKTLLGQGEGHNKR